MKQNGVIRNNEGVGAAYFKIEELEWFISKARSWSWSLLLQKRGVGVVYFESEELESSILKAWSRSRRRYFKNWDVGVGVAEKNLQLRNSG